MSELTVSGPEDWPDSLPDECPECGGAVSANIRERTPMGVTDATVWCAGDTHRDDGTECGWEAKWPPYGQNTVTIEFVGAEWYAGGDPVRCVECDTWVEAGESCDHIEHTEEEVRAVGRR